MTEPSFDLAGKKVYVAGHRGMVGSALVRRLAQEKCTLLTASRAELDLTSQAQVHAWMDAYRPDAIFLAAAKVGGILANDTQPADFLYENLIIEANVLHAAHMYGVKRIMFLGSSCIYPKFADQPISEDSLLTGSLEPTNQWYAIAKIAGLKLCEAYKRQYGHDYFSVMPSNLYGPGDNFDLTSSHVLPALIRKAHEAKISQISKITIWGTGTPRREFLYVDDCADACVFLMKRHSGETHVNIGAGDDISILDLTNLVCKIVGFEGEIAHDLTKPDGTPRKVMNVSKLHQLGWQPKTTLEAGIAQTYQAFLRETEQGRGLRRLA